MWEWILVLLFIIFVGALLVKLGGKSEGPVIRMLLRRWPKYANLARGTGGRLAGPNWFKRKMHGKIDIFYTKRLRVKRDADVNEDDIIPFASTEDFSEGLYIVMPRDLFTKPGGVYLKYLLKAFNKANWRLEQLEGQLATMTDILKTETDVKVAREFMMRVLEDIRRVRGGMFVETKKGEKVVEISEEKPAKEKETQAIK